MAGIEEKVKETLKQWFTKVKEKDAQVTGSLLRFQTEELAKKINKNDFIHMQGQLEQTHVFL